MNTTQNPDESQHRQSQTATRVTRPAIGQARLGDAKERQSLIDFLVDDWRLSIAADMKSRSGIEQFLRAGHVGYDRTPIEDLRQLAGERGHGIELDDGDNAR